MKKDVERWDLDGPKASKGKGRMEFVSNSEESGGGLKP